jgi:nitrite reductase/ring-hydroxylating ferredoxin subunit
MEIKVAHTAPRLSRFFLTALLCLLICCKGYDHPNFPKVPVNFYINPNEVYYLDLNYYGGHMYFTGGVNGVVVYRLSEWEFTAFDRACPHDWDTPEAYVVVESNGITLKCNKCGSVYNILDGGKISGPSKYPLKQYFTQFDGMRLRVHS